MLQHSFIHLKCETHWRIWFLILDLLDYIELLPTLSKINVLFSSYLRWLNTENSITQIKFLLENICSWGITWCLFFLLYSIPSLDATNRRGLWEFLCQNAFISLTLFSFMIFLWFAAWSRFTFIKALLPFCNEKHILQLSLD